VYRTEVLTGRISKNDPGVLVAYDSENNMTRLNICKLLQLPRNCTSRTVYMTLIQAECWPHGNYMRTREKLDDAMCP
jgi:hypothetical protein